MAEQQYFDDVWVGQELPWLTKGPLGEIHLFRWSATMENWHRIHYDRRFAVEHDKLPDLLINGSLKQQFMVQMVKDWAGREGWVWKVSFQFRAMNSVGETLHVWGRVKSTERLQDYGLVVLDLGIVNQDGKESTPGEATLALPFRNGRPVPYPFVPPTQTTTA
ncbi:MAG: acyl dehydratase [Aquabacterium sp.]|jgi:acyl dehydratase|uniref:acyl dehydratase n=1 Tax=Aquabacterium sp. TaxID=1872578 RepID=UPI001B75F2B8|nr:acyl dehydratase [Aquabacterium sp.]MBP7132300.1 acyl dehydratase [Aquabacterium sp.]